MNRWRVSQTGDVKLRTRWSVFRMVYICSVDSMETLQSLENVKRDISRKRMIRIPCIKHVLLACPCAKEVDWFGFCGARADTRAGDGVGYSIARCGTFAVEYRRITRFAGCPTQLKGCPRLGSESRSTAGIWEIAESDCARRNGDSDQRSAILAVCRHRSAVKRSASRLVVCDDYDRSHRNFPARTASKTRCRIRRISRWRSETPPNCAFPSWAPISDASPRKSKCYLTVFRELKRRTSSFSNCFSHVEPATAEN